MQLTEFYNKINQALKAINAQAKNETLDAIKIKLWHAKRLVHEMLYDPDSSTQANFNIQLKNGEDFSININRLDLNPFMKQLDYLLYGLNKILSYCEPPQNTTNTIV